MLCLENLTAALTNSTMLSLISKKHSCAAAIARRATHGLLWKCASQRSAKHACNICVQHGEGACATSASACLEGAPPDSCRLSSFYSSTIMLCCCFAAGCVNAGLRGMPAGAVLILCLQTHRLPMLSLFSCASSGHRKDAQRP